MPQRLIPYADDLSALFALAAAFTVSLADIEAVLRIASLVAGLAIAIRALLKKERRHK